MLCLKRIIQKPCSSFPDTQEAFQNSRQAEHGPRDKLTHQEYPKSESKFQLLTRKSCPQQTRQGAFGRKPDIPPAIAVPEKETNHTFPINPDTCCQISLLFLKLWGSSRITSWEKRGQHIRERTRRRKQCIHTQSSAPASATSAPEQTQKLQNWIFLGLPKLKLLHEFVDLGPLLV